MKVSIQAAKDALPDLIDAALSGEEVVIDDADGNAVMIVPAQQLRQFKFGVLRDIGPGPDFLEPMSEEDLAAWEGAA